MPNISAVELAQQLVRIDSRNPTLVPGAPGEGELARVLCDVLRDWGLRAELAQVADGRFNVIARVGAARAGARRLLFNGHIDVVDVAGMTHAPFSAEIRGGRIHGRGASDMKGGVAAMCAAAARASQHALQGELIIAAVVDEEYGSLGTSHLIRSGLIADAAVVTEPTGLAVAPAHKGFAWIDVEFRGRAAHGSRHDIGVDAIRHAGLLLAELDRLETTVLPQHTHRLLGRASLHASLIQGGSGLSTYPDECTLKVERRTLPGETGDDALREMVAACERVAAGRPHFSANCSLSLAQPPCDVPEDAAIVRALDSALESTGLPVRHEGMSAWTDAALLTEAGIPAICFGPGDMGMAHSDEEWLDVSQLEQATDVLTQLATSWCS